MRIIDNKKAGIIIILVLIMILIANIATYGIVVENNRNMEVQSANIYQGEKIKNIEDDNKSSIVVSIDDLDIENNANQNEVENNNANINTQKDKNLNKNVVNDSKYFIKVNILQNVVTIYTKDENGNYTKPVKAMVCSTGEYTPPRTSKYPNTKYKISSRYRWLSLQGNVYGQYATQVVGNILFHSVPYTSKEPSSLEWWEYDKLGTYASKGCIRLTVEDAMWIYYNISSGTVVEFYSDSNPGPLGKPSAKVISGNIENRGWDPTDPDSNNPWKNVKQEDKNKEENEQQNVVNSEIEEIDEKENKEASNISPENIEQNNEQNEIKQEINDENEQILEEDKDYNNDNGDGKVETIDNQKDKGLEN